MRVDDDTHSFVFIDEFYREAFGYNIRHRDL